MMISFPVVNDAKKFIEKLNPKNWQMLRQGITHAKKPLNTSDLNGFGRAHSQ
jgi:hypothetical protein